MGNSGQLDLFTITALDPPWRDNRDAMGYPFLSLQNGRTAPIHYSDENVYLSVSAPAELGVASIWDWDIVIFASSHLNEAIETGLKVSPRIEFAPYNCLKQIGRPVGGEHYQRLADAIRRLEATLVVTDIRLADQPERGYERPFRWLKDYGFPKKYSRHYTTPDGITHITPRDSTGEADPARPWMIELHPWLFNAIVRQGDILAVHPDYFQLRGGLERWLYRMARRAVPDKAEEPVLRFKMETLHARSGVTATLNRFAFRIRAIAATQPLPEYGVKVEHRKGRRELVTLYRDPAKPRRPPRGRRLKTIEGEPIKPVVTTDTYLDEEPPLVIVPEAISEPILENIADQVGPPLPSFTEEMSDRQFAVAFWKYLMEAESPQDLLDRMITLSTHYVGLPGSGGFDLLDGIQITTTPAPDVATRQSLEFQAKLQRAFDHFQSLANELRSGQAHPSWYADPSREEDQPR
jgi:plasmid replication initiation protein